MFLIWRWRPIYCLIYGPKSQETRKLKRVRGMFSFVIGLISGYLLWTLLTLNFSLSRKGMSSTLLTALVLLTAILYALSRGIRTVVLLTFVQLAGRAGTLYLRAMAFALIIAGPIENLVSNAEEVSRVFVCSTMLTYNLSKTRFDLMAKPFTNTLKNMDRDVDEIRQTFEELQGVLGDLKRAVEQSDIPDESGETRMHEVNITNPAVGRELPTASEMQERFKLNMMNRCKHQLDSGQRVCEKVFREGYRKCTTNFQWWVAKVICWPYRVDIICEVDVFGDPDKICDPSQVIPRNFGETYVELLRTEQELFDNSSEIVISYKLRDEEMAKSHLRSAERTTEGFTEEFKRHRRTFNRIMKVFEMFLCLFILRVPFYSLRYYFWYLENVDFDNLYITNYFKHVDQRLKKKRNVSILPLRTYEKVRYIDSKSFCSRSSEEVNKVFYTQLRFALELVCASIFLLFDRIVVDLLQIIRQRSLVRYDQRGEHEVRFNITGIGKMAQLLRVTMHNFNIHEHVATSLSNEECLPKPHVLPWSFYHWLMLLYLAIFVVVCYSHTFLRMRRVICGYFYEKREKQRILYLYNRILRLRALALQNLVEDVETNLAKYKVHRHLNPLLRLRSAWPQAFSWLRYFSWGQLNCLVCWDPEDQSFILCHNCGVPYCDVCTEEMNHVCINCEAVLTMHHGVVIDDESSIDVYVHRKRK
ncbi:DC-STAMP domain-containing protein 1 isoform X1 [Drosophila serrata]|uniref:DC-STAMP domain-containing protein 1 isoform X1 n=1 Tax=Drosophila serrata TaxID=7274 RepID=UPI000A1D0F8E|nr:DC-STAMP domain-containing protein 1 isoform X1 [Drosophila serrata]